MWSVELGLVANEQVFVQLGSKPFGFSQVCPSLSVAWGLIPVSTAPCFDAFIWVGNWDRLCPVIDGQHPLPVEELDVCLVDDSFGKCVVQLD